MGKRKAAQAATTEGPEVKKTCLETDDQNENMKDDQPRVLSDPGRATAAVKEKTDAEKCAEKLAKKALKQRPKLIIIRKKLGAKNNGISDQSSSATADVAATEHSNSSASGEMNSSTADHSDNGTSACLETAASERLSDAMSSDRLGHATSDMSASDSGSDGTEMPHLNVKDLQYLLLYAFRKGYNYLQPEWCRLVRPGKVSSTVLIVLRDLSITDFERHKKRFSFLQDTFQEDLMITMENPSQYSSTFDFDVYSVQMYKEQLRHLKEGVRVPIVFPRGSCVADQTSDKPLGESEEPSKDLDRPSSESEKPSCASDKPSSSASDKQSSVSDKSSDVTEKSPSGSDNSSNGSDKSSSVSDRLSDVSGEQANRSSKPSTALNGHDQSTSSSSKKEEEDEDEEEGPISKMDLLLSVQQMADENFPLPIPLPTDTDEEDSDEEKSQDYADYVFSKEKYAPVTPDSPMFAVDCEMCFTGKVNELTRVSIVNEENRVIYDQLVKPYNRIVNYNTEFSGITKRMLDPVTKRIGEVQQELRQLFPGDAILCGHSLNNDLHALKMFHCYVIDTSVMYNMAGYRKRKSRLKILAQHFLGRIIQDSTRGHDSTQDAKATMDLVKLKLQNTLSYGDAVLLGGLFPPGLEDYGHRRRRRPRRVKSTALATGSLFDVMYAWNVTACRVGKKKLACESAEEPGLSWYSVASEEDPTVKATQVAKHYKFTWVELSAFAELLERQGDADTAGDELSREDTKERKRVLKEMDRDVRTLVEKLPERTLVIVALSSRNTAQEDDRAAAFLHIT